MQLVSVARNGRHLTGCLRENLSDVQKHCLATINFTDTVENTRAHILRERASGFRLVPMTFLVPHNTHVVAMVNTHTKHAGR